MRDATKVTHGDLLAERKPWNGFAGELYSREDVFQNEMDVFYHKHWILIAVASDVPEPGDVYTVDIGKSSIIIVRGDEGDIRTFKNVCRHRGARLKEPGKSTVGLVVCPYHQWTYDLDGELRHAAQMGPEFERECRGLFKVPTQVIGGLVFVCLADNPPADIVNLEQVMEPRLLPYDLANTKIAHEADVIEEGNWKLVVDNNRECYHCAANHPSIMQSLGPDDIGYCLDELSEERRQAVMAFEQSVEDKRADWEKDGFISATVDEMKPENETMFRTMRFVISGAGESQTLDTKAACSRPLGNLQRKDLGSMHLWTHNSWTHVLGDYAVVSFLIPLAPNRTLLRSKWLVHPDAVEGVDYDLQRLTEVWAATNAEDAKLVSITQSGNQDPSFVPGPYSKYVETYVEEFAEWYTARLRAHGI
ncbi:aromatic ring-hydroxylating oxygenase subunit alpha [Caballeronia sp. DA-9]|uniref:aromatic ring-hydroxylating oxygenase subunit alpha n=1 Tax=Caballeronia sp. DA-9 TaxID=3436237 RepID=UPI003F66BEFD